jgi:hypothetical protein
LTTLLTARPAKWEDISGTFDLDFGISALQPNATSRLTKRWGFDDIVKGFKDLAGDIVDTFKKLGDVKVDKQVVFDVSVGSEGKRTNIFTENRYCIPS